ncbi:hypothetical protein JZ751_011099 [Albula glossodonta]|uniref:Uncharacterized protein n=1 Tax=Albula glossodonta TaxID=121402 RepID=A0A8T2NW76_9TELE|nr:hypothetical protein JZ751_011099 [Albula glossodonta]
MFSCLRWVVLSLITIQNARLWDRIRVGTDLGSEPDSCHCNTVHLCQSSAPGPLVAVSRWVPELSFMRGNLLGQERGKKREEHMKGGSCVCAILGSIPPLSTLIIFNGIIKWEDCTAVCLKLLHQTGCFMCPT